MAQQKETTNKKVDSSTVVINTRASFGASAAPTHFDIIQETKIIRNHLKVKELRAILEEFLKISAGGSTIQPSMTVFDALRNEMYALEDDDPTKNILSLLTTIMLAAYQRKQVAITIKEQ